MACDPEFDYGPQHGPVNGGMDNFIQGFALLRIIKYDPTEFWPVENTLLGEDIFTKNRYYLCESSGTRLNDLSCNDVCVDNRDIMLGREYF